MTEALTIAATFLVGVAASLVGTMVGGGSLLSIPFLVFLGLPPHVAIATDRFAGLGAAVTATLRFAHTRAIVWRHVPLLAGLTLVGSLAGATLLVNVAIGSLDTVVGLLLLALLPVLFLRPSFGVAPRDVGRPRFVLGVVLYLAIQVLAGFFGGGTGTLIYYVLMACFGITIVQVAATQIVPFLVLTLVSLAVFMSEGIVDYERGLVLMAGAAVGGHLAAMLATRRGEVWVRRVFAVVVLASAVRLIV